MEHMYRDALPQLGDEVFLTDSGLETDLIFHGGFELPEFAAFILLGDPAGTAALEAYFRAHCDIAAEHGCGVILEAPTWRASQDWGALTGHPATELRRVNTSAIDLVSRVRAGYAGAGRVPVVVSGCIGPRADAYQPAFAMSVDEAEDYHREQIGVFAASDADLVHAMTIGYPAEAIGIARAAQRANIPVVISFTTGTDGRLLDGTTLADAITAVDDATGGAPAYYGVNCAHPSHFASALPGGELGDRVRSVRANASSKSSAELDESPDLDEGDPDQLAADYLGLRARHPQLTILGGCCGTDARHVRAIADAVLSPASQ
jgi:S-methylmethionine-dependent homocysteine/selenocysteine methylase